MWCVNGVCHTDEPSDLPVWGRGAHESGCWHMGTGCSRLQPSVLLRHSAATPSSPSGWRGEGSCQRSGGQGQRCRGHREGRPECLLKSLATCGRGFSRIVIELSGNLFLILRRSRWSLCSLLLCSANYQWVDNWHVWFTASFNEICRDVPDYDGWLWKHVISYYLSVLTYLI